MRNYKRNWASSASGSKWRLVAGTYQVKAQARCTTDNSVESGWSQGLSVNISTQPVQKPNLGPSQPSGWADKIVVSNKKNTSLDASLLYSTDLLYVDWAVLNGSTADINMGFSVALYVDGTLKGTFSTGYVKAGNYLQWKDYLIGSLSAGIHTIRIVADSGGVIDESNEEDNEYTKNITVLPAQLGFEWIFDRANGSDLQNLICWHELHEIKGTFTLNNQGNRIINLELTLLSRPTTPMIRRIIS